VDRIDALRRLVELSPESDALRNQLRRALLARAVIVATSDRAEARSRFKEAATLNPNDPRIWQALCNLADSRMEQMQCLRALLRVAPDHHQGRRKLRQILIESGRELLASDCREESRLCWREAIDIAGGDVELWLGLAEATLDADEQAQAIQSAYELDPRDLRTLDALYRSRGEEIDPTTLPSPEDAFARFEPAPNPAAAGLDVEPVDDSALEALARLPETSAPISTEPMNAPIVNGHAVVNGHAIEPAYLEMSTVEADPETASGVIDAPPSAAAVEAGLDAPVSAGPAAATPASDAHTVMVVDDSPTIRKILGLTLERAGYHVVAEPNGKSALKRLEEIVPRVILLDIAMPDLDGYEVCKRIKQDPRTSAVPVIMLSGKGAFFDKVKGHMAGATEYLTKPFETPVVLAVVSTHCRSNAEASHG
jgi:twitching motility two-component system response regulator PilG